MLCVADAALSASSVSTKNPPGEPTVKGEKSMVSVQVSSAGRWAAVAQSVCAEPLSGKLTGKLISEKFKAALPLLHTAFGLNDSPVALAAYLLEKYAVWSNVDNRFCADGCILKHFTLDDVSCYSGIACFGLLLVEV